MADRVKDVVEEVESVWCLDVPEDAIQTFMEECGEDLAGLSIADVAWEVVSYVVPLLEVEA